MKVIISASEMQTFIKAEKMRINDFMAIVDIWTPLVNHYDGIFVNEYDLKALQVSVANMQGQPKAAMKICKQFHAIIKDKGFGAETFNDKFVFTVTCDGVIAINNTMHEFKADKAIDLSPVFLLKMSNVDKAEVNMNSLMDMVYRSRVAGTRNITGSRIGCDCVVHRLGADLLNELNPIIDKLVETIKPNQAVLTLFEADQVKLKVVG